MGKGIAGMPALGTTDRETSDAWAKELLEMKKRIGMEHIGLCTDDGGHLRGRKEQDGEGGLLEQ